MSSHVPTLSEYTVHLTAQGKPATSIRTYLSVLNNLQDRVNVPLSRISQGTVDKLIVQMMKQGYSQNTINLAKNVLRGYSKWAGNALDLRTRKANLNEPRVPTPYQICKAADRSGSIWIQAVILTLYSSGIRLREMVGNEINDTPPMMIQGLDLDHHTFKVYGKGGRPEQAWFALEPRRAERSIQRLLNRTRKRKGPLFPFSPTYVQTEVRRAGKNAGLKLHPHLLRHACATHIGEKTGDLMLVNKILRHRSIQTTMRYVHVEEAKISKFIGAQT